MGLGGGGRQKHLLSATWGTAAVWGASPTAVLGEATRRASDDPVARRRGGGGRRVSETPSGGGARGAPALGPGVVPLSQRCIQDDFSTPDGEILAKTARCLLDTRRTNGGQGVGGARCPRGGTARRGRGVAPVSVVGKAGEIFREFKTRGDVSLN